MVDVDSEKWTAYAETARFPARSIWAREGRTLLAFERLAAARFDHSLFVSEHEWQRFVALAPEAAQRTSWISNGVDFDYFSPSHDFAPPFAAKAPIWCSPAAWTTGRTSTRCSGSRVT